MNKFKNGFIMMICVAFIFTACGGEKPTPQPAEDVSAPPQAEPVAEKAVPTPAPTQNGNIIKIGDFSELWSQLYKQNEAVINQFEGMPIMALVTPPLTFATSVQYDILNLENQNGRFEGKLMLAGYQGFVEKTGSRISFGYDHTLDKDGFGPSAKAGDKTIQNGFLDLDQEFYQAESSTERAGKKIKRGVTEFKRLKDGSMICLDFSGNTIDMRGNAVNNDQVIFLHNGQDRYDFVVAKGQKGTDFQAISFADKGDLTKEQAIELFKAAGYTLDKVGGIKDGKLVLDPQ